MLGKFLFLLAGNCKHNSEAHGESSYATCHKVRNCFGLINLPKSFVNICCMIHKTKALDISGYDVVQILKGVEYP